MRRFSLLAALLTLPLAGALAPSASAARTATLPAFESCSELVRFGRAAAVRPPVPMRATGAGFYGIGSLILPRAIRPEPKPVPPGQLPPDGIAVPVSAMPSTSPEAFDAVDDVQATEEFSGTNVQEDGIDEPDAIKTDGKRLFVVVGAELWAYDVTGAAPKLLSKLSLEGAGGEILLFGDRVLVLGPQPAAAAVGSRTQTADTPGAVAPVPVSLPAPSVTDAMVVAPQEQTTRLAEVDARNPAAMKIVRTMAVPGTVVSARLTRGSIRVVMSSPAALPGAATASAAATRSGAAPKPTMRTFVPRTTLRSRRTKRTFRRYLVPCDNVRHPVAISGSDLLTILTVDFKDGLFNVDRDAVMAGAQVVYASASSLYVASTRAIEIDAPADIPRKMVTEIHRFDTTKDGETSYLGSGTVPGFALDQYALSEHGGDLRVATTEVPNWLPGAERVESQSHVTVLRPAGPGAAPLRQIGQVSGLGPGEQIYATRFIDDRAYV
ncbi:MAG: beta-propeller domain-containing protein, partial [Solirubrobacteraceae bacterium]|nr:beta-propeller domain-containing protein [Solirubrobacteraceae bacterium]